MPRDRPRWLEPTEESAARFAVCFGVAFGDGAAFEAALCNGGGVKPRSNGLEDCFGLVLGFAFGVVFACGLSTRDDAEPAEGRVGISGHSKRDKSPREPGPPPGVVPGWL